MHSNSLELMGRVADQIGYMMRAFLWDTRYHPGNTFFEAIHYYHINIQGLFAEAVIHIEDRTDWRNDAA